MCLTTLTSTQTEDIEGEGWKVVFKGENNSNFFFIYGCSKDAQPYNQWLERQLPKTIKQQIDKNFATALEPWGTSIPMWLQAGSKWGLPAYTQDKDTYPFGFHIFLTEQDASCWRDKTNPACRDCVIVKVKYKTILARGTQDGLPCIVAQFINVGCSSLPNVNINFSLLPSPSNNASIKNVMPS